MLIASAVAALSLGVVTLYGKGVILQSGALGSMLNYSQLSVLSQNYSSGSYFGGVQQGSYSAAISGRNESVSYPLVTRSDITNFTGLVHCTNFGFYGGILNVQGQCGTYDAWDYIGSDSRCPRSTAYCVFAVDTGYSVSDVGSGATYVYNFTLSLSSQSGTMRSRVSGGSSSPLLIGNETVGYVRVVGVSGTDPAPSVALIGNGTSYLLLDQQAYSQYQQWQSEAYGEMRYYNSSSVSADVEASLQQYTASYIAASKALRSSGSMAPCGVKSGNYTCGVSHPLSYLIQVALTGFPPAYNQTIYYLGSEIELRGA